MRFAFGKHDHTVPDNDTFCRLRHMGEDVLQKKSEIVSWGIGLSAEQAALLREALGEGHSLILHSEYPTESPYEEGSQPCVLWLSSRAAAMFDRLALPEKQFFDQAAKALLLDENYALADFENACDFGVTEIIRPPCSHERVMEVMRRALEAQFIQHDMSCMSREILLERELLSL